MLDSSTKKPGAAAAPAGKSKGDRDAGGGGSASGQLAGLGASGQLDKKLAGEGDDTSGQGGRQSARGAGAGSKAGSDPSLRGSVGLGGQNAKADVLAVQRQLAARGIDPGPADGLIGPKTRKAIEQFQRTYWPHPDGLIEPGKTTEKKLFGSTEQVKASDPTRPQQKGAGNGAQPGNKDKKNDGPQQVANDGSLPNVRSGVKLTSSITAALEVLSPYLPRGVVVTSGLRTDADQARVINVYFNSHGGPARIKDVEARRQWLVNHRDMTIARVGASPHRTGLAFDLSGSGLTGIVATVKKCAKEHPGQFHFSRSLIEYGNNCVHIEVSE